MRFLFLTLCTSDDSFKGDYKLIRQRINILKTLGHEVDVLFFRPSFFLSSIPCRISNPLPHLGNSLLLKYSLPLALLIAPFLFISHLLRKYPLQTFLSRLIALQLRQQLHDLSLSYDQLHAFHFRSYFLVSSIHYKLPSIFELIDSYYLNYSRLLLSSMSPIRKLLIRFELKRVYQLEHHLIFSTSNRLHPVFVSAVDAKSISLNNPSCKSHVVPLYVDTPAYQPITYLPQTPLRLIFFGNLDYPPNILAVQELFGILKTAKYHFPNLQLELTVAGRNLSSALSNASAGLPNITFISPVDDMHNLVSSHHVCVLPMNISSGLQSKLIESFSWSMPVITTTTCYSSLSSTLNLSNSPNCFLADTQEDFISTLYSIYTGTVNINKYTELAHSHVLNGLSFTAVSSTYEKLLLSVAT